MSNTGSAEQWNRGVFFGLRLLMRFIAAIQFIYAIYYDNVYVNPPSHITNSFGGKLKYLTHINVIIQALYFTIALLNDFIGTNDVSPKKPPTIRKLKDYIFAAFAFPLALNVGISFWTLMAIDRELVLPKVLDAFFPTWLNHVMHTNIVIFILLETFTSFRRYPSKAKGLTGLTIFISAYLVWIHVIHHFSGTWVYPVLNVLDFPQRTAFFAVTVLFGTSLYFVGEFLNNKIWSAELRTKGKSAKGKNK